MSVVGWIVLAVIALATVSGWATSGITRIGREFGFVVGLLVGLAVSTALAGLAHGIGGKALVVIGGTLAGALIGAALLGGIGRVVADGLHHVRLGWVDRGIGAALSAITAVIVCALFVHLLGAAAPSSRLGRELHHGIVGHVLGEAARTGPAVVAPGE